MCSCWCKEERSFIFFPTATGYTEKQKSLWSKWLQHSRKWRGSPLPPQTNASDGEVEEVEGEGSRSLLWPSKLVKLTPQSASVGGSHFDSGPKVKWEARRKTCWIPVWDRPAFQNRSKMRNLASDCLIKLLSQTRKDRNKNSDSITSLNFHRAGLEVLHFAGRSRSSLPIRLYYFSWKFFGYRKLKYWSCQEL